MRSILSVLMVAMFFLVCILNCGGGEKNEQKVREEVKEKMKKAEQKKGAHDARAAYEMALKEAKKWDSNARLYQIEGEKNLKPDGTAMMWTAHFAVQEDPENTPNREQGKKLIVLMMQQRVMDVKEKSTPQEISWTSPCHAFLPDDWMNSQEAYVACLSALKEKHGAAAQEGTHKHFICNSRRYRVDGEWVRKPKWELTSSIAGSPALAQIHAVTGEVLEVK